MPKRCSVVRKRGSSPTLVSGEDGRAVLEAIFAAYESARTGRKVALPFATKAAKPHDLRRGDSAVV